MAKRLFRIEFSFQPTVVDASGVARVGEWQSVAVDAVAKRAVNPVEWYVGHVEPIQEIDVLPQIDGYLKKVNFREGDMVKEGDVLVGRRFARAVALRHLPAAVRPFCPPKLGCQSVG